MISRPPPLTSESAGIPAIPSNQTETAKARQVTRLSSPSPKSHLNYRCFHDRYKEMATLAGLNVEEWHLHRFRDTAGIRWLRAGIDVRTVQAWLGHESLATTQKYLEQSRDTEKALSQMGSPF